MLAKQLSVFIENRQGRLGEVLAVLKQSGVNIQSLSLADTTEYGLLRLIVDNPELGKEKLVNAGFSAMLTNVLIVKIPHYPGALQDVLSVITEKEINVEYMYALTVGGEEASVVIKTSDIERAQKAFEGLV